MGQFTDLILTVLYQSFKLKSATFKCYTVVDHCHPPMPLFTSVCFPMQTVRVLLQHGGNPHHVNEQGLTPIDVCTHPDIVKLLKSHDLGRTPTGSESSNKDAEENPCPKRNHSGSRDSADITDKEEMSPVFSPDGAPVTMTTPTQQAMTTPSQVLPTQTKKTRLRGVSFSDISSSESELELIEDSKEFERDGPVSKEPRMDTTLLAEKASKDEQPRGINGVEKLSEIGRAESEKIESSPEPEQGRDSSSPVDQNRDISPFAEGPASTNSEHEEAAPQVVAPGHVSREGTESEEEQMLLSFPLSVVKVSSSRERREETVSMETKGGYRNLG